MKDFLGQELAVDDTVVYVDIAGRQGTELRKGTVVKITPKMVKVTPITPRRWEGQGYERTCYPHRLVKVATEG